MYSQAAPPLLLPVLSTPLPPVLSPVLPPPPLSLLAPPPPPPHAASAMQRASAAPGQALDPFMVLFSLLGSSARVIRADFVNAVAIVPGSLVTVDEHLHGVELLRCGKAFEV